MTNAVNDVPWEKLRWRLDPASLPFETTNDIEPLTEIIGQNRGVEAFRFGMRMTQRGYNVFVTGTAGTGRLTTVKKMLQEMSKEDRIPDDLCYMNNFRNPEEPVLLRLKGGAGIVFKQDTAGLVERLKKEIPQVFESEEYISLPVIIIDHGIEILTGVPAGERSSDGTYPEGTVNCLVDRRLMEFARGLKEVGESEPSEKTKKKQTGKRKGKGGKA